MSMASVLLWDRTMLRVDRTSSPVEWALDHDFSGDARWRDAVRRCWSAGVLAATALAACNTDAGTGLWLRDADPVVLTGAQLTDLVGAAPGDIVAFRYDTDAGAWDQVPVQVDQRHVERLTKLRNGTGTTGPDHPRLLGPGRQRRRRPGGHLRRQRRGRLHGRRHRRRGAPGGAGNPAGIVAGSGVRVTVTDPLAASGGEPGQRRRLRLPLRALGPGALARGRRRLRRLRLRTRPTRWATPRTPRWRPTRYTTHFAARWTRDGLTLGAGPDILDRHRNLFAVGVCGRSEDTFSAGDGGYATNVDGPVRVIRSYLGANSGTYTQREHIFYRQTERVQTFLRVHAIPGIMDFYDLSAAAVGMTLPSSSTAGVTVDGVPDAVGTAAPTWEAVTGDPGHARVHQLARHQTSPR